MQILKRKWENNEKNDVLGYVAFFFMFMIQIAERDK